MKPLYLLLVCLALSVPGFSQPSKDSVACIPLPQLREAARVNERYRILKVEDSVKTTRIRLLEKGLENRDSTINDFKEKDENSKQRIINMEKQNLICQAKFNDQGRLNDNLKKQLSGAKTKTWVIGGAAVTLLAGLILKK